MLESSAGSSLQGGAAPAAHRLHHAPWERFLVSKTGVRLVRSCTTSRRRSDAQHVGSPETFRDFSVRSRAHKLHIGRGRELDVVGGVDGGAHGGR